MENPYLAPQRVRAALRSLDLRPTRGMGQNFLVDAQALAQIVTTAALGLTDTVCEIGPGLGVLTWELLQRAGSVVAVELDRRLAARLREEFQPALVRGRLHLVQGNVLHLPPAEIINEAAPQQRPAYKVVANLPYAITAPVLRHFLDSDYKPVLMVVLVQWEVAQRICAAPGDLSMLAHAIQFAAEPQIIARVPAGSFVPAPAVDSAILRLDIRPAPAVAVDDPAALFQIIKAGFLQPRKKLANALPGGLAALGRPVERATAVAALEAAGVSPDRRAETLTLTEWARVWQALRAGFDS